MQKPGQICSLPGATKRWSRKRYTSPQGHDSVSLASMLTLELMKASHTFSATKQVSFGPSAASNMRAHQFRWVRPEDLQTSKTFQQTPWISKQNVLHVRRLRSSWIPVSQHLLVSCDHKWTHESNKNWMPIFRDQECRLFEASHWGSIIIIIITIHPESFLRPSHWPIGPRFDGPPTAGAMG